MKRIGILAAALLATGLLAHPASAIGAPAIERPTDGSTLSGISPQTVHFTGTASPNATVDVVDNSTTAVVGSSAADDGGAWTLDAPMSDGSHTVQAVEAGAAVPSDAITFTVDSNRPTAPHITSPKDNDVFKPGSAPVAQGTATDNHGVFAVQIDYYLLNKMMLRENASCDGCGTPSASWTDTPKLTIPGYYVAKAASYDMAGNRSDVSQVTFFTSGVGSVPVVIPTVPSAPQAPPPPVIETPEPRKIFPGAGSGPAGTPINIGGVAGPGTTVSLFETKDGGGYMGATVADSKTGRWIIGVKLTGGEYGFQARATNARGRTSPLGVRVSFAVDDQRPVLTTQVETDPMVFAPLQPVVISGRTDDDRHVKAVQLEYWLGDKLMLVENASCPDCAGGVAAEWTDTPQLSTPGYYYVNVRAIDVAGNRSLTESVRFIKVA